MSKKSELSVEQRTQLMLRMRVARPPRRALEQESVECLGAQLAGYPHRAVRREARAVARAVPGAFGRVPCDATPHVRAVRRHRVCCELLLLSRNSQMKHAVAIAGPFVNPYRCT